MVESQQVPADVKKLYDWSTGAPHPMMKIRKRSDRHSGMDDSFVSSVQTNDGAGNAQTAFYRGRMLSALLSAVNVKYSRPCRSLGRWMTI